MANRTQYVESGSTVRIQSVDTSGELSRTVVQSEDAGVLQLLWFDGEEPVFPPREGSMIRVIRQEVGGRELSVQAQVVRLTEEGLVVALEGPPVLFERRSYLRVPAPLPLRYERLDRDTERQFWEELKDGRQAVPAHGSPARRTEGTEHPAVAELQAQVDALERVVHRMAAYLGIPAEIGSNSPELRRIRQANVSGSGLRFAVDHPIERETRLLVDFELPTDPPAQIRVLFEVTRCEPHAGTQVVSGEAVEVAGRFMAIHEDDRAAIVRYSYRRQREIMS